MWHRRPSLAAGLASLLAAGRRPDYSNGRRRLQQPPPPTASPFAREDAIVVAEEDVNTSSPEKTSSHVYHLQKRWCQYVAAPVA
jgi:hypothetical protein